MIAEAAWTAAVEPALRALEWLATYLIHSTLLLGAAYLLDGRLVRSWGGRELLWKIAVIGSVVTASGQLLLRGQEEIAGATTDPRRVVHVGEPPQPAGGAPDRAVIGLGGAPYPPPLAAPRLRVGVDAPPTVAAVGPVALVLAAILAIWVVGALAGAGRLVAARIGLLRWLRRHMIVAPAETRELLEALCRGAGYRRPVRVTESPAIPGPIAVGRGEICLPTRVRLEMDVEHQRSVLAHELAHLVRSDPGWLVALALVERVLFVQPLNRLAARRIRDAFEILADDWATAHVDRLALARCIATVAGWRAEWPRRLAVAGMAAPGMLRSRVGRLVGSSGD